ncbi:putative 18S rRNA (guanine-N(7))-methyltransferase [Dermatophagoides farinae]|uniref:putative 18S rRNA (guanine-N(7))-methyltransferase n=1 Tax=Dermatophagoides farinae TaxID=6954 RepID=UPI003F5DE256
MANPKADFVLADIGTKQDFEPGSYAGAISVSCIQWLCHSFQSDHNPRTRLRVFFQWLYDVLSTDARAVLQFYPSDDNQVALIGKAAASVGFSTFFYVDNPDSKKNKKLFLICTFGQPTDPDSVIASALSEMNSTEHGRKLKNGKKGAQSRKQRVLNKKERQRSLGKVIKNDSKYTARKRKDKF